MTPRASSSPSLSSHGVIEPVPFVGRAEELTGAVIGLAERGVLLLRGQAGSGKSRMAEYLATRVAIPGVRRSARVCCHEGDTADVVYRRAERELGLLPGALARAAARQAAADWLLIIDDAHLLCEAQARALMVTARGFAGAQSGRLLVVVRDPLPARADGAWIELALGGLSAAAARELWRHLEAAYGPADDGACERALAGTSGLPSEVLHAYACAISGHDPWTESDLWPEPLRRVLAISVILAVPATAADVAVVLGPDVRPRELGAAFAQAAALQLIEPVADGRYRVPEAVRQQVLATVSVERRASMAHAAWERVLEGALEVSHPIERARLGARLALAAGDAARAAAIVVSGLETSFGHGAAGELDGLLADLAVAAPERAPIIAAARARIAAHDGRVAQALEFGAGAAGFDRVDAAFLRFRAGDVADAIEQLGALVDAESPDERCRAAAVLAEIELARGAANEAYRLVTRAFERDRAVLCDQTRARLHMALAAVEEHAGRIAAARASLARAAAAGALDPMVAAGIEARRSACLVAEGRFEEASSALAGALRMALEVDATSVADEIRRAHARLAWHRGDALEATRVLGELAWASRRRGDEVGALRAEIDLARVHAERGALAQAAALTTACAASAAQRELAGLAAEIRHIGSVIDTAEMASARAALEPGAQARAPLDETLSLARDADIAGDRERASSLAKSAASQALRQGRRAHLVDALCLCARLSLIRGDYAGARAEATRAVEEADAHGLERGAVRARLVLCALAREQGDTEAALAHARAAGERAATAGLPIERLVASSAVEAIFTDMGAEASDGDAARATMAAPALSASARLSSELGLTAARPYRAISADGSHSHVADPERLGLEDRALVIDAVREVIVRNGRVVADLRRRTLLKRLVFLLARAPGQVFTKEDIVETVWRVAYHPLRHDAALFTNIMRIRRLLGEDGADIVRVCDDGYRLVAPADYICVEFVDSSRQD